MEKSYLAISIKSLPAVLESMGRDDDFTLDNLLAIDQWARIKASEFINRR